MPIPIIAYFVFDVENCLWHAVIIFFLCLASVAASVWFIGLTNNMRQMLLAKVMNRFSLIK